MFWLIDIGVVNSGRLLLLGKGGATKPGSNEKWKSGVL